MSGRRLHFVLTVLWLAAAACSEGGPVAPPEPRRLEATAGASADTIGAWIPGGIAVRLSGAQATLPGLGIAFRNAGPATALFVANGLPPDSQVVAPLGPDGRAAVSVLLGERAGQARVVVTSSLGGVEDTVPLTVLPGAFASNRGQDTVVTVGTQFRLRGTPLDRAGNERADSIFFFANGIDELLDVQPDGSASARAIGQSWVTLRHVSAGSPYGYGVGMAYITIVPRGTLVGLAQSGGLLLSSIDGARQTNLGTVHASSPSWSPDGRTLVAVSAGTLALVNPATGALTPLPTSGIVQADHPEFSRDGAWIYFSGQQDGHGRAFRVHPDGSGLERLSDEPAFAPSPSPDGNAVVYISNGAVRILDLRTRESRTFQIPGWSFTPVIARWSPNGARIAIAITGGGLVVAAPDGTNPQDCGQGFGDPAFSPDSRWIVGADSSGLHLCDPVFDPGLGRVGRLDLPGISVASPGWRPEP